MRTKSPEEWEWPEWKWQRLAAEQRSLFDVPELPDDAPAASRAFAPLANHTPSPNVVRPAIITSVAMEEEPLILG